MPSFNLFGVRIDCLTRKEVEQILLQYLKGDGGHFVFTANTEALYHAYKNKAYQDLLREADLSIADSQGVIKAAKYCGIKLPERIPGVEIAEWLLGLPDTPCYVLGTEDKVLKRLNYLNIVGKHHGFFKKEEEEKIIEDILAKKPKVLLVALGMGQQEEWIVRNKERLNIPIMIGVGGATDVLTGIKKRAPLFMRRLGLEWLYRLMKEPWRFGRQLNLIKFTWVVLKKGRRIYK